MWTTRATAPRWTRSTSTLVSVVVAGGVTATAVLGQHQRSPRAAVVISEVTSDGDDRIELHNTGATPAHLDGWSLVDSDPAHTPYELPRGTTLAPGAYLVLRRGEAHAFGLGEADGLMLRDVEGNTVDTTSWYTDAASPSWCRLADSGLMVACESASFGGPNRAAAPLAALGPEHD
jgi:hypothetical protein